MEKQKLPNSTAVLVLGILSILMCCCSILSIPLGIIGLVLGQGAIKLHNQNPDQYEGISNVKTGKILCIIGIVLTILYLAYSFFSIQQVGGWDTYIQSIKDGIESGQYQYRSE